MKKRKYVKQILRFKDRTGDQVVVDHYFDGEIFIGCFSPNNQLRTILLNKNQARRLAHVLLLAGMKRTRRKNLLSDESIATLREMLTATERAVGTDSQSARLIRRTLERKLDEGRR